MADVANAPARMQIFRAVDAPDLMKSGCMTVAPVTDIQRSGLGQVVAAGFLEGEETRVLVNLPGFSLTYAWFKKDYPLPLHSHDSDCLYFIVAGSLRLGSEELGARDSFFVPANVPYTYRPGEQGVEVLEIRHEAAFNFLNLAKGAAFWDKAAATITANRENWRTAERPSAIA